MTTFTTKVSLPNIPESNASYRKRLDALAKLAGKAPALEQALELVTGTNTYAKMLRKYGAALIAEAKGEPLPVAPVKVKAAPAGAVPVDAVLAALGEAPATPAPFLGQTMVDESGAAEMAGDINAMVAKAKAINVKADKAAAAAAAKLAKLEAREAAANAKEAAKAAPKTKPVFDAVTEATLDANDKAMAASAKVGTAKLKATVLTPEERKAKQAADRKRQRDAVKAKEAAGE